jgi:hypothetical protein
MVMQLVMPLFLILQNLNQYAYKKAPNFRTALLRLNAGLLSCSSEAYKIIFSPTKGHTFGRQM